MSESRVRRWPPGVGVGIWPESEPRYLRVDLMGVRAANTLVIHYDLERDGWVIQSPTKMAWYEGEDSTDEQLEEVAFVPAWSERAEAALEELNR